MELEVFGELGTREAGFTFKLDFVEDKDGVVGGSYEKLAGGGVHLVGG